MNIIPASDAEGRGSVAADSGTFRIAILSTPRTGNTWLRRLLDVIYTLPQIVADAPEDVDWDQLPQQCILQLHWPAEKQLESLLLQHEFRILTLFRHPCDTLISILHFATSWENTVLWMRGMKGDESEIVGARPCGREFARYVESDRARLLIAASSDWGQSEHCLPVSYESLVEDPVAELTRLTDRLLPANPEVIATAIQSNTLARLRACVQNQHFWRGQPGTWKTLLPLAVAQNIERHHAAAFETMGYTIDGDPKLTSTAADANWTTLELATLRQEMAESRRQLRQATDQLDKSRWKIRDLEIAYEQAQARIDPLIEVSPMILNLSTRVNRVTRFYRGALATIRRSLGMRETVIPTATNDAR